MRHPSLLVLVSTALMSLPVPAAPQEAQPARADWETQSRPAVVRGTDWLLRDSQTSGPAERRFRYGPGGVPVFGDWDGDGMKTPGWFSSGTWYLRNTLTSGPPDLVLRYGSAGDIPVVGDWVAGDPEFTDELGVVRPSDEGLLWLLGSERREDGSISTDGRADLRFHFGSNTDTPVVGRWRRQLCQDCHEGAHVGVVRETDGALTWYLETDRPTGSQPASDGVADIRFAFGSASGDRPIVGDWDGNFLDDPGVIRGDGVWLVETDVSRQGQWIATTSDGDHERSFAYGEADAGDVFRVYTAPPEL